MLLIVIMDIVIISLSSKHNGKAILKSVSNFIYWLDLLLHEDNVTVANKPCAYFKSDHRENLAHQLLFLVRKGLVEMKDLYFLYI